MLPWAYEELMALPAHTVQRVCPLPGNQRDADDVCQEVMLKVLYGLKNFEGKSKFKTWLYSITYNQCITQYRKERRKRRLLDALSLDPLEEASDEKAPKLEEKGGWIAWPADAQSHRSGILVLRFVAELEFQEIADIMHMGRARPRCAIACTRPFARKLAAPANLICENNLSHGFGYFVTMPAKLFPAAWRGQLLIVK